MRQGAKTALITAFLIVGAAAVRAADRPAGLEIRDLRHFSLTDDPFSGPVETLVNTDHLTVARGQLTDVFVVVQNHSNEATVSVVIDLELRYADGALVQPFHLGAERAQTLGPDEGIGFYIFWQIPPDASLGVATFTVNATVGRISGGTDDHTSNDNPMIASDSVSFEVLP